MDKHFDLETMEGQGTRSSIKGLVRKGTLNLVFDLLIIYNNIILNKWNHYFCNHYSCKLKIYPIYSFDHLGLNINHIYLILEASHIE